MPDQMKEDGKKQKHLEGQLSAQLNWAFAEIAEKTDSKLSKWNLSKLQQQLKPQTKNSTGINAVEASGPEASLVPPPPIPDLASFTDTMERTINAALARTGRPTS